VVHADDNRKNDFSHMAHDSKVCHTERTTMATDIDTENGADKVLLHTAAVDHPMSWASSANFLRDEDGDAAESESAATAEICYNVVMDGAWKNHPKAPLRIFHDEQHLQLLRSERRDSILHVCALS
jgi:hypothetical protein